MTGSLGPPPVAAPAGTRSSQTGAPAAPVPGFLSVNGERIESTNALVDRLGTPGLKGTARSAAAAVSRAAVRRERRADASLAACAPLRPLLTAVVEAYSESWGPCGSVAPLMRKFILEVAPPAKALQVLVVRPACKRRNARRRGFAAARRAPLASRAALRRRFRGARSARRRATRCWRSSATRRCRTFCFSATAICATPSWAQTSPRWSACCASTSPSPKTRWSTPRCGAGSCFRVAFAFAQFR